MMRRLLSVFCLLACLLSATPRGVEIRWDDFGVGHVYARDLEGLFFGYGYVQMKSHGNLILKLYGESRGRAAEYFGPRSAEPALSGGTDNVANDRWVRLNNAPARAAHWLALQAPDYQRGFAAFAEGMNAAAADLGNELDPAGRAVLPIEPVDSLLHVHRIVHFAYLSSMARVSAAAKAQRALEINDTRPTAAARESNAWAIAPARSASGNAMLLMNPHLPFADWYTYYETHLVAPEAGIDLYGASQIGFPMLRFVFSDFLGFTQTVNGINASDLYQLTLTADGTGYVFDGEARPFATRTETIKIKQPDGSFAEEPLVIRESVHGPVVWEADGLTLAIRTAGLDRPYLIEQYWRMALARSFADYEAQVRRLEVPTFNITAATADGHIQYLYNGTLPKRPAIDGVDWSGLIPGDTSATLWTEYYDYDDLPKVTDPATGWVQNTNNPPWAGTWPATLDPADFPAEITGTALTPRTVASLRMLHDDPAITFEELVAYQHNTRLEIADRILPDLIAAAAASPSPLAREAGAVLAAWDGRTEVDSRGALLFDTFARKFLSPTLRDLSGFAVADDWRQPFTTPRGIADPAAAVAQLEAAATETRKKFGALDAPWGEFRRFQAGDLDLPASGSDGNLGSFRVFRYAPAAKNSPVQRAVFGDTWVALVEFGTPLRARVLMSYGNSSMPGNPHATDQFPLLSRQEMRTPHLTRAEVEAHTILVDQF